MTEQDPNRIDTLCSNVLTAIANETDVTAERIRTLIELYRQLPLFDVSDDEAEALARDIEARLDITMSIGSVVQEEFTPWLNVAKTEIEPYYWDRYQRLLEQKNFPPAVIAKLDEVTDRILGLLENPGKPGPWDRRGMVVGHVQSGKTANYTGLISKAADAGYRLIIVIAGIHNNLRNQTQKRIDEGFVGRDSSRLQSGTNKFVGVGRFDSRRLPVTFTSAARDFNRATATAVGLGINVLREPAVLVIKKNPSTLRNVIDWLRTHSASGSSKFVDAPMLLIDDEADNASIDISRNPDEASRINGQIRSLLSLFHRSCYVGYTATPFANIFIDPETEHDMIGADLFPRDFIVSLDAPSNYFGAARVFSPDAEPHAVRQITDNENLLPLRHRNGHAVTGLPHSLSTAIRCFVLSRAIRLFRGQDRDHNSMLVNASRFTSVQSELRNVIHTDLVSMKRNVRYGYDASRPAREAIRNPDIRLLHETFQDEYADCGAAWEDILPLLHDAISVIEVVEVNSRSSGALRYSEHEEAGFNVIAVGGFSLSRGLTLEGLTVSYFLRNSMMYDTLMQMGRWFGYRPDYEDLCRIWMTPDAEGWYEHITGSIEEVRDELREMEQAGLTPRDFGLKVRSHPDTLIVTARNKMGSGVQVNVRIGLANRFIETTTLWRRSDRVDANRRAAASLISGISEITGHDADPPQGNYLWRGVPAQPVIDFVGAYRNHPRALHTDGRPVQEYIRRRAGDELSEWDVVVISKSKDDRDALIDMLFGPDMPVRCQDRSMGGKSTPEYALVTDKQRVASRGVERIGLTPEQISEAERRYRETDECRRRLRANPNASVNYPDRYYRHERRHPLLIVHLIRLLERATNGDRKPVKDGAVVAWGISFPGSAYEDQTVEYVVNTTWWRENFGQEVDEEETEGDDSE